MNTFKSQFDKTKAEINALGEIDREQVNKAVSDIRAALKQNEFHCGNMALFFVLVEYMASREAIKN